MWPRTELQPEVSLQAMCSVNFLHGNTQHTLGRKDSLAVPYTFPAAREWTLVDKTKVKGQFDGCSLSSGRGLKINIVSPDEYGRDQVVKEITIPFEYLSQSSLRDAMDDLRSMPRRSNFQSYADKTAIGNAVEAFINDFGCLPPAAIVDTNGSPILSWRVLLLPYLGHADLFELFHLDEPWDSDHNRKLLPYMPLVYSPNRINEPSNATLLAVTGPGTAFLDGSIQRFYDSHFKMEQVLMFVEVQEDFAVEWTKPIDTVASPVQELTAKLRPIQSDTETICRGWFANKTMRKFKIRDGKMSF